MTDQATRTWTIDVFGAHLAENDLTAGELALWQTLTCSVLPHAELDLHPLHCAVCRVQLAVVAMNAAGVKIEDAAARVSAMGAAELTGCVTFEAETVETGSFT